MKTAPAPNMDAKKNCLAPFPTRASRNWNFKTPGILFLTQNTTGPNWIPRRTFWCRFPTVYRDKLISRALEFVFGQKPPWSPNGSQEKLLGASSQPCKSKADFSDPWGLFLAETVPALNLIPREKAVSRGCSAKQTTNRNQYAPRRTRQRLA